jgi:DNA end-binding protein Ku
MPARAIWKGVLRFGEAAVPVKFYSALNDRKVHFRLLHQPDHVPVIQRMVHPRSGKPVPAEEIRSGYETAEGRIVVLERDELNDLEPEPSREILITRFVPPERIPTQWYDRPYYLGPDGAGTGYFELAAALAREDRQGVARWTMRKKRYLGVLAARDGFLKIVTLRHAEEVVDASDLPRPHSRELEAQEKRLAEQLVLALEDDFDPDAFRESYSERVRDLIRKKAQGVESLPIKKAKRKAQAASLAASLEQSLEQAKKRRKHA